VWHGQNKRTVGVSRLAFLFAIVCATELVLLACSEPVKPPGFLAIGCLFAGSMMQTVVTAAICPYGLDGDHQQSVAVVTIVVSVWNDAAASQTDVDLHEGAIALVLMFVNVQVGFLVVTVVETNYHSVNVSLVVSN